MQFIDFHCDTASILLEKKDKNILDSDLKVDIKKLKKAGALAQFFALFIEVNNGESYNKKCIDMLNNLEEQINENNDKIEICTNIEEYNKVKNSGKIGAFLTIEEGEAIEGDLKNLRYFKDRGVSLMTLTWNFENKIGYPNCSEKFRDKGLKNFGIEVIEEMNSLGMIIDVSHLSDGGFLDVAKYSKYPFVASHSNARNLCNHSRNLTDDMIRILSNKGGVTGINFCAYFLGNSKVAMISDMVEHIKHIKNIGGIDCIALGSDFDGIDNEVEIKDISEMSSLAHALLKNGFTEAEIDKIFYKNSERIIKDVLK
ncbi:membrane dipeptidase [Clostridium cavendishii DSM 21758]|uniref:Membrane dipeptidase n=1 Tax=Clostridium cavendishii DSM 21758 TaxID=1121302 RepID=A0A1M6A9U2_9CLOT|nr:dipeptidase [Clostridium cavendishii]SHI32923.1 membrane dipeptidase [Clostridium cavendishii DSM 21758]